MTTVVLLALGVAMPCAVEAQEPDSEGGEVAGEAGPAGEGAVDDGGTGDTAPAPVEAPAGPTGTEPAPAQAPAASVAVGNVIFVARPGEGVMVMDLSDPALPAVVDVLLPGQDVSGLHLVGTTLVAVLADYSVVTWDVSVPLEPVTLAGGQDPVVETSVPDTWEPAPEVVPIEGTVTSVDHGWIVLDVGEAQGVVPGMRFAVLGSYKMPTAIVTVHAVTAGSAMGPLPARGTASVGDRVASTCAEWKTKNWMLDGGGQGGTTQLGLHFSPIVGVGRGADSWGFIGSFELSHVFEKPAKIALLLAPVALGHSPSGVGAVFEFGAMGGLSTRYFEYMFGFGGHLSSALHDDHALLLNSVRIGSVNSLHFRFLFTWILPSPIKALPTTTTFGVDLPVTPRTALYVEIGGGNLTHYFDNDGSGWANMLIGLRTMLVGTGGPGTVILSTGLGHGYSWDQRCEDDMGNDIPCVGGSTWGPLVSMGLDWRF